MNMVNQAGKYNEIIKNRRIWILEKVDDGIKKLNAGLGVHHLIELDDEDEIDIFSQILFGMNI